MKTTFYQILISVNALQYNYFPQKNKKYLEHTLMSGMLLQLNQTIKDNQLHIVVTLLYNQINVALGSSLEINNTQHA